MKTVILIIAAFGFVASFAMGAIAQEKATTEAEKPAVYREKEVTMAGTIQAIDLDKRIVTVKGGPKEQVIDLKVDARVKNLSRLQVGDKVKVTYYESFTVRVMKPGEVKAEETAKKVEAITPGAGVRHTIVTATIQDIDRNTNNLFLRWPEGVVVGVRVNDPETLKNVKPGDQVEIAYVDTLAVSIEKANRQ
jgi:hypothetical protein